MPVSSYGHLISPSDPATNQNNLILSEQSIPYHLLLNLIPSLSSSVYGCPPPSHSPVNSVLILSNVTSLGFQDWVLVKGSIFWQVISYQISHCSWGFYFDVYTQMFYYFSWPMSYWMCICLDQSTGVRQVSYHFWYPSTSSFLIEILCF